MEGFLILLVLGFFLGWALGIAGYMRAGRLQRRVQALEEAVRTGAPLAAPAPPPPSPSRMSRNLSCRLWRCGRADPPPGQGE